VIQLEQWFFKTFYINDITTNSEHAFFFTEVRFPFWGSSWSAK